MTNVKSLLTEEICDQMKEVHAIAVGTDESKTAINGLGVLIDKHNDIVKAEIEREKLEIEREKVTVEMFKNEVERKDKIVKNVIAVGSVVAGITLPVIGFVGAWYADETGKTPFVGPTGRKALDKMLNFVIKK